MGMKASMDTDFAAFQRAIRSLRFPLDHQEGLGSFDEKKTTFSYKADRLVGSGSFGNVYKALVVETGKAVAIKKVTQDSRYKNRELSILKELRHPNVVKLEHSFYLLGDEMGETSVNLVMEYCSDTVYRILKHYAKAGQGVPKILVQLYSYQIGRALAFIHCLGICHRDIKPQNLLVDGRRHTLKLCDFGSAKYLVQGEPNVSYICSRYYRAPELIFGATEYTTSIDIWSMACVTAEIVLKKPLFPGATGVDQLVEIMKVLGTPSKAEVTALNSTYTQFEFPNIKPLMWAKVFSSCGSPELVDFFKTTLVYHPEKRPSGLECCAHPLFDDLRHPNTRLSNTRPLPDSLFHFSEQEKKVLLEPEQKLEAKLIPAWYKCGRASSTSTTASTSAVGTPLSQGQQSAEYESGGAQVPSQVSEAVSSQVPSAISA